MSLYPAGTCARLLVSLELECTHRSLAHVAYEMWLRGHPIALPVVCSHLEDVARAHDRITAWLRALGFGTNPLADRALRFVEWIVARSEPGPFRTMKERLGSDERVETLLRVVFDVATGSYQPPVLIAGPSDDEETLLATAGGFAPALRELERAVPSAPPGSNLVVASRILGGEWRADLAAVDAAALLAARDRWLGLRDGLLRVGEEMHEIFGRSFGLRTLGRLLRKLDDLDARLGVLVGLRIAQVGDASLCTGWDTLVLAGRRWSEEVSPWLPALRALRAIKPPGEIFAPHQMARLLVRPAEQAQYGAEIARVCAAHRAQVDAALRSVPTPSRRPGEGSQHRTALAL